MTVAVSTIYLRDVATGTSVEAELRDAIEEGQIADWKLRWQPALIAILREFEQRNVPRSQWPQSWHWNWAAKVAQVEGLLAFKGFCVVQDGLTQGLIRLDLTKSARLATQVRKPLVYVDYLEVAPWNRPHLDRAPRLRGVGKALLTAAVVLSDHEGFKGRVGLHSLPQSDGFYREHCGMTDTGPDATAQGLRYFEMTSHQARPFLEPEI
jgi:hypothetical protein